MLENTTDSTKRQSSARNRVISKRHSRDRFDRVSSFPNDNGEKDGSLSNNSIASVDRGGLSGTNNSNNNNTESLPPGIVRVHGCSNSELAKMMSDRWAAAVHSCNDPSLDATDRPVVYSSSGGGSGWGSSKLAYQPSVTDFLAEMTQERRRTSTNQVNTSTLSK